jgi:glycosyltransferase involved in cell wall biosynthesis
LLAQIPYLNTRIGDQKGGLISMRIALFSECYTPVLNGVVTSIQTLRDTLRAWGHTVYIIAPGTHQPDDDADVFRLPELPFPRYPFHFARPFPRLPADFPIDKVDVIHCQHPFTVGRLGAETARKYGIPMVYTAHSLYDNMAASAKSPIMRSLGPQAMRGMMRRFCDTADYVIVPSRTTRAALRDDRIQARFVVIPSGVRQPVARPEARQEIRAQIGLAEETPLLLYVGRIGPEKHLDLLLHSVKRLARRALPAPLSDFQLLIVGDGMSRHALEHETEHLGLQKRVHFVGEKPHETIGDWYAAADLFALPSPCETQGLVLVEAMWAGLPCVAIDEGGPKEIVRQGETGLRVPFEEEAFTNAIEFLLRDPETRQRLGENARLHANDHSPEAMARKVLAVYARTLALPHVTRLKGVQKLASRLKESQRRRRSLRASSRRLP